MSLELISPKSFSTSRLLLKNNHEEVTVIERTWCIT